MDLASSFTTYGVTNVEVPEGFTHAILHLFASATTFSGTGSGNVGVQPWAAGSAGSAISQGKTGGGAVSVSSTFAVKFAVPGPVQGVSDFDVWLSAYANGNPRDAGSGNVHMSGMCPVRSRLISRGHDRRGRCRWTWCLPSAYRAESKQPLAGGASRLTTAAPTDRSRTP